MENGLVEKVGNKVRKDGANLNTCGVSDAKARSYIQRE